MARYEVRAGEEVVLQRIHFDLYGLDCAEWLAALERWKRGG